MCDQCSTTTERERHGWDRRAFLLEGAAALGGLALAPRLLIGVKTPTAALAPALRIATQAAVYRELAPPPIITRAEWGADESLRTGTPAFAPIVKLVVHHTVTTNFDTDPAATVRGILVFHAVTNGWSDIGYNFLIDADGRIYEGRYAREYAAGEVHDGENVDGWGVIGAHAGAGWNTGTMGVALLGTFTASQPSGPAVDSLVDLLAWKASRHQIDPHGASAVTNVTTGEVLAYPNVAGHRDIKSTACPGDSFYPTLSTVRGRWPTSCSPAWSAIAFSGTTEPFPPSATPKA